VQTGAQLAQAGVLPFLYRHFGAGENRAAEARRAVARRLLRAIDSIARFWRFAIGFAAELRICM